MQGMMDFIRRLLAGSGNVAADPRTQNILAQLGAALSDPGSPGARLGNTVADITAAQIQGGEISRVGQSVGDHEGQHANAGISPLTIGRGSDNGSQVGRGRSLASPVASVSSAVGAPSIAGIAPPIGGGTAIATSIGGGTTGAGVNFAEMLGMITAKKEKDKEELSIQKMLEADLLKSINQNAPTGPTNPAVSSLPAVQLPVSDAASALGGELSPLPPLPSTSSFPNPNLAVPPTAFNNFAGSPRTGAVNIPFR